jgi:hypothetical protein
MFGKKEERRVKGHSRAAGYESEGGRRDLGRCVTDIRAELDKAGSSCGTQWQLGASNLKVLV